MIKVVYRGYEPDSRLLLQAIHEVGLQAYDDGGGEFEPPRADGVGIDPVAVEIVLWVGEKAAGGAVGAMAGAVLRPRLERALDGFRRRTPRATAEIVGDSQDSGK